MSKSVEGGRLLHVSPTSISTWDAGDPFGCPRKWWFKYVAGLPAPQDAKMQRGDELHKLVERFLGTGVLYFPKGDVRMRTMVQALMPRLDSLRAAQDAGAKIVIEQPARILLDGVVCTGKVDVRLLNEDGRIVEVIDWKTTSDLKWAKSQQQMRKDTQLMVYAEDARWRGAHNPLKLTLEYVTEQGARASSSILVEPSDIDSALVGVTKKVAAMKLDAAKESPEDVVADRSKCGRCPYQTHCPKGTLMPSLLEVLTGSTSSTKPPEPAAPAPTGVVPPDAPKISRVKAMIADLAPQSEQPFQAVPPPAEAASPAPAVPTPPPPPPVEQGARRGPGRPPGSKNRLKLVEPGTFPPAQELRITKATYSQGFTLNLGNFNSTRVDASAEAQVPEGMTYEAAMAQLKLKVVAELEAMEALIKEKSTLNPNVKELK